MTKRNFDETEYNRRVTIALKKANIVPRKDMTIAEMMIRMKIYRQLLNERK